MHLMKLSSLVVGVACLGLVGCANKAPKQLRHQDSEQCEPESALTQGAGECAEFINKDNDNSCLTDNCASNNCTNQNQTTYLFAFDRFDVADHDLASIHAHADYLAKHPNTKIYINGHTDQRGSREYNVALGERRARSVARILRSKGVLASQIKIVSYGSEKPVAMGEDESAYSQNRRAEAVYE